MYIVFLQLDQTPALLVTFDSKVGYMGKMGNKTLPNKILQFLTPGIVQWL